MKMKMNKPKYKIGDHNDLLIESINKFHRVFLEKQWSKEDSEYLRWLQEEIVELLVKVRNKRVWLSDE